MPEMGRSWREISHTEDLSAEEVRGMLHSLALALRDLHDKGVAHGGLCLRHVLRVPEVGTAPAEASALSSLAAVLIDFTSVSMHNGYSTKDSNVATTNVVLGGNSAYLPPDVLCASETGVIEFSCIRASTGSDIWAFGAIMYALCTGRTLFHCDRYENLCDAADSHRLLGWLADSAPLHSDIRAKLVRDPDAADLLCNLLQPCIERRLGSVDEALQHPYFESEVARLPTPPLHNRTVPVDVGESVDLTEHGKTNGIECVHPEESAPQLQSDVFQRIDASEAISASGDAGVVQALLAAMQQGAEASQSAAFLSQSINVCESRVIGQEGGFLRGIQGISVEIPPLAMAPGSSKEVSLEVLEGAGKYAALPSVSPIVRITPCNYQFRRPVYVTLPHCLLHATKANLSVALFDSVYGLRNVLDPNAVQYLPQNIRFPVSFACDVVATFR
jgi:serine/threonine protein kinase